MRTAEWIHTFAVGRKIPQAPTVPSSHYLTMISFQSRRVFPLRLCALPSLAGIFLTCLLMPAAALAETKSEEVLAHPAIPAVDASELYQVRVNGVPVPVNDESYFDFHTAFFSMGKPVTVEVEFADKAPFVSIHPQRHGIDPKQEDNKIAFKLEKPLKLVIKSKGAKPLVLCATPWNKTCPPRTIPR